MYPKNKTFEEVSSSILDILKKEYHRKERTLRNHVLAWNRLKQFMVAQQVECPTPDICDAFLLEISGGKDLHTLSRSEKSIFTSTFLFKDFLLYGKVVVKKMNFKFEGEIGLLMLQYMEQRKQDRISILTINHDRLNLGRFWEYLTTHNILKISDLTESVIIDYLRNDFKYKSYGNKFIHYVRPFLRYLYNNQYIKVDLASIIPKEHYNKQPKLPSVYSEEEIRKILISVDRSTAIGKRDYAILCLASILGLRASDIANLKFKNIHWEHNIIRLVQYKTGKEIVLPLLPEIGNSIIEYLRYGRKKSNSQYVFLQSCSPYKKINAFLITQIARKYFAIAKIDTRNKHHGAHALRHSLAALLLSEKVKLPVISEVLGHSSTETTKYYLRVDIQALKQCTLSVPEVDSKFYSQKGGYFYE